MLTMGKIVKYKFKNMNYRNNGIRWALAVMADALGWFLQVNPFLGVNSEDFNLIPVGINIRFVDLSCLTSICKGATVLPFAISFRLSKTNRILKLSILQVVTKFLLQI